MPLAFQHRLLIRWCIIPTFSCWNSVHLDKGGFLPHRELYSYQLKNFLEFEMNLPNRTCMIYFSDNKKKIDKEALKVLGKYKKNKSIVLQKIDPEKFRFTKPEE